MMFPNELSVSDAELNWRLEHVFRSPVVLITQLQCRPDRHDGKCEKRTTSHQVVFIKRGGFVRRTGVGSVILNSTKAAFFLAGEPYQTSHFDSGGDDCIVLSVDREALAEYWPSHPQRSCHANIDHAIVAAGRGLFQSVALGAPAQRIEERALDLVAGVLAASCEHSDQPRQPTDSDGVLELERLLTTDCKSSWTLSRLAAAVGWSPFYLSHRFHAVTGISLRRYMINLRLAEGLERLCAGERNISMLAADLGFSSHAHFSSAFKNAFGVSPSATRANALASVRKNLKASTVRRR